jgi:hypothetical protein
VLVEPWDLPDDVGVVAADARRAVAAVAKILGG